MPLHHNTHSAAEHLDDTFDNRPTVSDQIVHLLAAHSGSAFYIIQIPGEVVSSRGFALSKYFASENSPFEPRIDRFLTHSILIVNDATSSAYEHIPQNDAGVVNELCMVKETYLGTDVSNVNEQ
jgi:hypothetical protein